MNLNKQLQLAAALFGRDEQSGVVSRATATATADSEGGSVTVEFDDGTPIEVPATGAIQSGDTVIIEMQDGAPIAAGAAGWGDRVQTIAQDAQAVAEATGQHFWHRDTNPDGAGAGAFITDTEQDDFLDAAADGFSDYDPDAKPYANMLLNSLGVLIRNALHTFASFTKDAVRFYNEDDEQVAEFGSNGAVIGRDGNGLTRLELTSDGLDLIVGSPHVYLNPASIHKDAFTFGLRVDDTRVGYFSFVEGNSAAFGDRSHAEGYGTYAKGTASHAQNYYTTAGSDYQTALGKYNIEDAADAYALIIGNGTAYNARSNALTVAWNGDVTAAGDITDGSNNTLATIAGSIPSAATTAPSMDGTAAAGTSTDYARADHVHPTDTSRQEALISGTNIKTINNESLLGSGNITIQGGGGDITTWYGTSTTAASTQTKVVTCADFVLTEGALIVVYFSNKNTYGSLKLNVNDTGALNVYHRGAVSAASNFVTWDAKSYVLFQYNGTGWVFLTASDGRIISAKDRQNSANIGIWGTGGVDHLICKASTMTTGTPSTDGHIIDLDWDASYPQHAQLFLPCVQGYYPQWRMQTGNTTWTPWDTLYTYANPPTGLGAFKFARYIPTSAAAQSLTTSVSAVNAVSVLDAGDSALVTNPATGVYEFAAAGTYRIKAQLGMYPNTTARTRLCVGLYDTSTSGTRLAMGVHMVTGMNANSASMVTTVACEYTGVFAAGDRIALGAFADVTAAKVTKSSSGDLTNITFEKLA